MPFVKPVHLHRFKLGGFSVECSFACKAQLCFSFNVLLPINFMGKANILLKGNLVSCLKRAQPT